MPIAAEHCQREPVLETKELGEGSGEHPTALMKTLLGRCCRAQAALRATFASTAGATPKIGGSIGFW